jgi:rod shape-determining protein MreD
MSREVSSRRLPVVITLVVGLMLSIMPLPNLIAPFRPDWLALLLIFWAMQLPRTWSIGTAWIIGLILDVSYGTLLGQHALALCVIVFITVRFHLRSHTGRRSSRVR